MSLRSSIAASLAVLGLVIGCESDPIPGGGHTSDAGAGGACEPTSCEQAGIDCGELDDGCGSSLRCGEECPAMGGQGGGSGDCNAEPVTTAPRGARHAQSLGFLGDPDDYVALFDGACELGADCVDACVQAGGTEEMCADSQCLPGEGNVMGCVPPPVWDKLASIQFEDDDLVDMTQTVVVQSSFHDSLLVDEFGLEVPAGATILGISVEVLHAADDDVADYSVRLLKAAQLGKGERASAEAWPFEPAWATYGGDSDLWGEEWEPSDVNAPEFGVALSAAYAAQAGNARAYVDHVRVSVRYAPPCQ